MYIADISAAIATRDRPDRLGRCLRAMLNAEVLPAEVIVVDQSRDDATRMVVAQCHEERIPIVYVRDERQGLSASRNTALVHARSPKLAVTDDDCVPDVGWIGAIDRAFASLTAPDAVSGPVLPWGPAVPGLFAVSSRTSMQQAEFYGKALPWIVGTGGNFAVKTAWARQIGNYDDRLGVGSPGQAGEDMDFIYRLLRAGASIRYDPAAIVFHEQQSSARRRATRHSYGRGIGACCGIWLRSGDSYALFILGAWLILRARLLGSSLVRRRWSDSWDELCVQSGTLCGLAYGLRT